jgi:hypothetical protein
MDKSSTTENDPCSKGALPRKRIGVPKQKNQNLPSGKNKFKTLLTRPASLEITRFPCIFACMSPPI